MRTGVAGTAGLGVAFVILWNSGFIGAEYGLPYAGTFTLLFWRYVALTVILLGFLLARGQALWPGLPAVCSAGFVGVLAHGCWLSFVLLSLDMGVPAGIIALVVALQPLATGAFSGMATGERTDFRQWLGLLTGFCGVAIAVGGSLAGPGSVPVMGYVLPVGSVVAITVASLFQRRQDQASRALPLPIALLYQSAATALVLLPAALAVEGLAADWQPPFILTMSWLVLGVSLGAYGAMWLLLARLDATRVASLFYLGPPVTMLMAWLAFGDPVYATDLAGFWAKFVLVKASLETGAYLIAATALVVGLLTIFSMTKIWGEAFWKPHPDGDAAAEGGPNAAERRLLLALIAFLSTVAFARFAERRLRRSDPEERADVDAQRRDDPA